MKVLVTGATGFLGSWLTKALVDQGREVRVLRRESSDISEISNLNIEHFIGDVTDPQSLIAATKDVETVYHLAGLIGYASHLWPLMEKINVVGTKNVIDACKANSVKKLIHISSVVAIGAGLDSSQILNEESTFNLSDYNFCYFETKRRGEALVKAACDAGEIDAVILNPTTIYGPGDAKKGSRGTQLKVAKGKFPFYSGGGVNIINVNDAVDAIIAAEAKGRTGERYILAGENITIRQLLYTIAECAGVEPPKIKLPVPVQLTLGRIGDLITKLGCKFPITHDAALVSTMFHWFDSSKAQKELGLKVTPAKESIRQSVQWIKDNGLIKNS